MAFSFAPKGREKYTKYTPLPQSMPPLNSQPLLPSGRPPPGTTGDVAQPLTKAAQDNARAVRAERMKSAFAEDVDYADQRKRRRNDGLVVRGRQLPAERTGEKDNAAPSRGLA